MDAQRFVEAQEPVYAAVLAELAAGRKRSHWMWFIFPQLAGLGHSSTARFFALQDAAEARAYLQHPLLGQRLEECTALVLALPEIPPEKIFGAVDTLKFRSSLTLFASVAGDDSPYARALETFYGGRPDEKTLQLLAAP